MLYCAFKNTLHVGCYELCCYIRKKPTVVLKAIRRVPMLMQAELALASLFPATTIAAFRKKKQNTATNNISIEHDWANY